MRPLHGRDDWRLAQRGHRPGGGSINGQEIWRRASADAEDRPCCAEAPQHPTACRPARNDLIGRPPRGGSPAATRTIAKDIGVSRTTVVEAFERLASEGLIVSRTGSGSFVSQALLASNRTSMDRGSRPSKREEPRLARVMARGSAAFFARLPHIPRAFTTALPAFDAFPMALWSRHVAKHWRARRDVVLGYRQRAWSLSAQACDCSTSPRQPRNFVRAGTGLRRQRRTARFPAHRQHAARSRRQRMVRNPGAIGARNCFAAAGANLVPIRIDHEGLVVEEGLRRAPNFRLAFVTPSHQQPLGSTMSLRRRIRPVGCRRGRGRLGHRRRLRWRVLLPRPSASTLKSIDTSGRVIYVGTFSKTLFPALRLGYILSPPAWSTFRAHFMEAFFPGVPSNPQAVVADFMDEGHFSAHIRRMRKLYAERHDALHTAAQKHLAGLIEIARTDTGLHTVGYLAPSIPEKEVAERARARDPTVAPLGRYVIAPTDLNGLVLGFSGVKPAEIDKGGRVLGEVLTGLAGERASRRSRPVAARQNSSLGLRPPS